MLLTALSLDLSGHGSIEYNYDPLYLRTVTRRSPRGDPLYTHTYTTYDHSGNLLTETPIGNLEQIEHTLDLKGRKIAISSSCFSQTCSYDSVDNLTQTDINGKAYSYTYDELSQLTSEATPETLETYVNDSNYNQTRKNGSAIQPNFPQNLYLGL